MVIIVPVAAWSQYCEQVPPAVERDPTDYMPLGVPE